MMWAVLGVTIFLILAVVIYVTIAMQMHKDEIQSELARTEEILTEEQKVRLQKDNELVNKISTADQTISTVLNENVNNTKKQANDIDDLKKNVADFNKLSSAIKVNSSSGTKTGRDITDLPGSGIANLDLLAKVNAVNSLTVNKGLKTDTIESGNIALASGSTVSAKGRMHVTGDERLYLLNKDGVIIGKEWGGTGNLNVQGQASLDGGVVVPNGGTISSPGRMHIAGNERLYLLNKDGVTIGKEWGGNGNLTVQGSQWTGGDHVHAGGNNWIFHTPDDGRTTMYVAPGDRYDSQNWNWSKSVEFRANGDLVLNGGNLVANGGANLAGNLRANGGVSMPNGATIASDGRMHITGGEILYLLNKNGVIIGKEWGGTGGLYAQGDVAVDGTISQYARGRGDGWNWIKVERQGGADQLYFGGDNNNRGIWSSGDRPVSIYTSGQNRFSVDATGNVTIPSGKLCIGNVCLSQQQLQNIKNGVNGGNA